MDGCQCGRKSPGGAGVVLKFLATGGRLQLGFVVPGGFLYMFWSSQTMVRYKNHDLRVLPTRNLVDLGGFKESAAPIPFNDES